MDYISNNIHKLPKFLGQCPIHCFEWMSDPTLKYIDAMLIAAKRILEMKVLGLSSVHVAVNWIQHRVLHLKEKTNYGW
jgi:hypothetical protein